MVCHQRYLYRIDPRSLRLTPSPLPFPVPGDYPDVVFDAQGRLWLYFQQAAYRFEPTTRRYTYYLGRDDQHPYAPPIQKLAHGGGSALYALSGQGALRYEPLTDNRYFLAATRAPARWPRR